MSVGEILGAVAGLFVIIFLIFGLVMFVSGLWSLSREGLTDLRESLRNRHSSREARRIRELREAAWTSEKDAVERERLAFTLDEPGCVSAAASDGKNLVTAHRDGSIRFRSLSDRGRITGEFPTGYERPVRSVGISPDGRYLATAERFVATGEIRRSDGEIRGTVSAKPSEAFEAWDATADDSDGYLHLNEYIEGFVFTAAEDGATLLTVVWGYRYGPDGGPSPVYGSGALLVRRFRLPGKDTSEAGAISPVSEEMHDLGGYLLDQRTALLDDGYVATASGRNVAVIGPGESDARPVREEVGWPLISSPDGSLLVSTTPVGRLAASERTRKGLAVWDARTGERLRSWEDEVISFGPTVAISPDGEVLAIETGEKWSISGPGVGDAIERGYVRLYEIGSGALICRLLLSPVLLAFDPTGELLYTVEESGVKAWRV